MVAQELSAWLWGSAKHTHQGIARLSPPVRNEHWGAAQSLKCAGMANSLSHSACQSNVLHAGQSGDVHGRVWYQMVMAQTGWQAPDGIRPSLRSVCAARYLSLPGRGDLGSALAGERSDGVLHVLSHRGCHRAQSDCKAPHATPPISPCTPRERRHDVRALGKSPSLRFAAHADDAGTTLTL
jgi:hypothetical protein